MKSTRRKGQNRREPWRRRFASLVLFLLVAGVAAAFCCFVPTDSLPAKVLGGWKGERDPAWSPASSPASWSLEAINQSIVRVRVPVAQGIVNGGKDYETRYDDSVAMTIDEQGHLLTCAHSLRGMTEKGVFITLPGHDALYAADIVWKQEDIDLAILRTRVSGLKPIAFVNDTVGALGQEVVMVGFPTTTKYTNNSVPQFAKGLVSCVDRRLGGQGKAKGLTRMIEIQGWAHPGFSGGPAVLANGQVLGVVVYRFQEKEGWGGYSLATPADVVRRFLDDARAKRFRK